MFLAQLKISKPPNGFVNRRSTHPTRHLVRVPGSSQALSDDAALAAVINWVLTEFNSATLADDFEPLTAKEVKGARSDVLMNPLKFRAELWRHYTGS